MTEFFIGLMSGTSLDGVDGVLASFDQGVQVVGKASRTFPPAFRAELLALNTPGHNELHRAALAANQLAAHYAEVIGQLVEQAHAQGIASDRITAAGAHGQTVRHCPQAFGDAAVGLPPTGYTLQLNNPALIAELSGIDVVADFRSADVAAGGQGAPLVPAFHASLWSRPGVARAILNIGGISNLSLLRGDGQISGFDCGPGNALMDYWCDKHTGKAFDAQGAWAASGKVDAALLATLLNHAYFLQPPPKSTGRDLFNPAWLEAQLGDCKLAPQDVQATLTALTAQSCAEALNRHLPGADELLICGGGALNDELMRQLGKLLPATAVRSTSEAGLPPLQVEAAAFAWLAKAWFDNRAGNLTAVTGAQGPRVLGALYKARRAVRLD
ncbi:MAG: anhydro-N-acetylmuramic acid kinase [Pseudomonadota bacterium]